VPDEAKIDPSPFATGAEDWAAMLQKAEAGDPAATEWVQRTVARPEVMSLVGNLARQVELVVLDRLAGKDLIYREGVTRKLETLRRDLAGPSPTPIEAGLAERAALDWLVLHDAELRLAAIVAGEGRRAAFWEKRVDAAHRRYIAAVKALAAVRKMAVPVLIGQLNIAGRQVNNQTAGA
jgi:hypothetical protein